MTAREGRVRIVCYAFFLRKELPEGDGALIRREVIANFARGIKGKREEIPRDFSTWG
jgi:hypothetical protein